MNNLWAMLPMRASNDLLGDPEALRARLDEDSYLYFSEVLDPERVLGLRAEIISIMVAAEWIIGGRFAPQAISIISPVSERDEAFQDVYQQIQRLESFHALAHAPELTAIMRAVVGDTAFAHPLKIARLSFPTNHEISTPPHQDFPNNQGSPSLTASWIPLGDCPADMGALAILRGSHRWGVLPLDLHPGPGTRQAVLPLAMLEELRWVTTDFAAGDVLLFPSTTVHASLHNSSDSIRLSVDFRFQPEGEPLTPIVLEPHFQRLTWDEVYAGWSSTELQHYWRGLDYEVVPFEDLPLVNGPPPEEMPEDALWKHLLRQEKRHDQRLARLAEAGISPETA